MIYAITFIVAFSVSLTLTPVISWIMHKLGVLDLPNSRKIHSMPIPRMGGLAMVSAFYIAVFFAWKFEPHLHEIHKYYLELLGIFFGGLLVVLLGIYDDTVGADVCHKLFIQGVAGLILFVCGLGVREAFVPFIGYLKINPVIGAFMTILWITAVINIFNLIDGLDGLASGVALISALVFLSVAYMKHLAFMGVLCCAFLGGTSGFLRYNFFPAQIFMGDTGSMFLGFILGSISLLGGMTYLKASTVTFTFLAMGLPIFDTTYAIIRRARRGSHIFGADKEHVHHQFIRSGLSHRNAVLAIYSICAVLGVLAIIVASFYESGFTGRLY